MSRRRLDPHTGYWYDIDDWEWEEPDHRECRCGRGSYDANEHRTCYTCYLERRESYVNCIWCGQWHSPEYGTCFQCRGIAGRDEAGRNLKLDILIRDEFTCQNRGCGSHDDLQVDHIEPCVKGGTAMPWNLQALCRSCNKTKGAEYDWRWEQRRIDLMHLYFTFGWSLLDDDQRDELRADAGEHGDEFAWHAHYKQQPSIADTAAMQLLADAET
jgi:5-methylcytosine-specific restriction endonuclease McrA